MPRTMETAPPDTPSPRAAMACGGLLTLWLVASVAGPAYLPTHDGPQHVYTLHVATRLADAATGWGRWYEPTLPVTGHGFALFFGPLDAWLPWPLALRGALAALVALWATGALALARSLHPQRTWLGVALAAAALQWTLYMGLFAFYAASALGLWVLALAARPGGGPGRRLSLAGLLGVQALMHVVPAVLTGGLVLGLALARALPGERLRELARTSAVGAPAALVALALLRVGLGTLGDLNEADGPARELSSAPWWTLGKCFLAGPAWRAWPLTAAAALAPALAVLAARGRPGPRDGALLLGGGALLLAAAALPLHIRAWDFFSVRFLPLGVAALVLALPLERLAPRGRRLAAAACALFAVSATAWAHGYQGRLAAEAAPALAGLEADLPRDGTRLPMVLDPYLGRPYDDARAPVPFAVPLLNLGQLYAATQGGIVPYSFVTNPHLHPVVMPEERARGAFRAVDRKYAAELARPVHAGDRELRRAITTYVAAHATGTQDVILWGEPSDAERLGELGFAFDFRRGGLAIARFEGCPLRVRFPADAPISDDDVLELGWAPALQTTHRYTVGRAARAPDGSRVLPLRQSCGGVWLRLARGEPGSNGHRLRCQGADAGGRLHVREVRAAPEVLCRAVPDGV